MQAQDIEQEARDWLVYLYSEGVDDNGRERFKRWLAESEAHVSHYVALEKVWRDLPLADDLLETSNVEDTSRSGLARLQKRPYLAVAAAVVAICFSVLLFSNFASQPLQIQSDRYVTQVGQIDRITLADDSVVILDTRSAISVAYGKDARRVTLEQGRAFFEVTENPQKPFVIRAGTGLIQVVGTKFEVARESGGTQVRVTEGVVAVAASVTPGASVQTANAVQVQRGQQVSTTRRGKVSAVETFDVNTEISWQKGRFSYVNESLATVVEDVNRYRIKPLQVTDSDLHDMSVTLSFSLDQINTLTDGLERSLPITVTEDENAVYINSKR